MLNNITNYTNLIDNKKVRTLLEATDLFTIGVRDSNFYGNYQPALITATDLVSSIAGLLPPATASWGAISGNINTQGDLISLLNTKQDDITLTTIGKSGVATLVGSTLNIPDYTSENLQKEITATYVLTDADNDYTIFVNNGATAISISLGAITVPNFSVGFIQQGVADVTFVGVMTNPIGLKIKGQGYQVFIERKLSTALYYLLGNTKA
jgi:hypothetical protein